MYVSCLYHQAEAMAHEKEILEQQVEQLRLDKQVADAALVTTSRELVDKDSMIARLKTFSYEAEK